MYNFEMVDYDSLDEILDFSIYVIEFFRNDQLMIRDFLCSKSPWDFLVCYELNISTEELIKQKENMLRSIISRYNEYIKAIYYESKINDDDDEINLSVLDSEILEYIRCNPNLMSIFKYNNLCPIKLINMYIKIIEERYDINIHTGNLYKYEIKKLINMYLEIMKSNNINTNLIFEDKLEDKQKYIKFYRDLYIKVKNDIEESFSNEYEIRNYIDYIYSLTYAYLKVEEESNEELIDEEKNFILMVESGEDLYENFFNDANSAAIVIENIYDNYEEYGDDYDLRRLVKSKKSKEIFENLDPYYYNKFEPQSMMNDITLNSKLKSALWNIKFVNDADNNEIQNLLMDEKNCLYGLLYSLGLDPRFESFYKNVMINIIITEVYEYLCYKKNMNEELKIKIENMSNTLKDMINLFFDNSYELLDLFYEYNSETLVQQEKTLLYNYNHKNLSKINELNDLMIWKYVGIILGYVKEYKSVEYINDIVKKINDSKGIFLTSQQETNMFINTICLYVYERIIVFGLSDNTSKKIIDVIEQSDDLTQYLLSNYELLKTILMVFTTFCGDESSYLEEGIVRKRIKDKDKIKVMKKLNMFNEI